MVIINVQYNRDAEESDEDQLFQYDLCSNYALSPVGSSPPRSHCTLHAEDSAVITKVEHMVLKYFFAVNRI